ncbi:3-hydroxyacyl-CoA dehydrogenase/enoyl-CoA hydratase family protein [Novosphingobium sp. KACC 22771]|uniref:3-hydroxyacyl-CoA dehydrogenase/enoyl-CoA hydratase family protein n=1 Tax=Novosphingobium sp. KACC 22771 TaxID=3025670 RepID=UPI0023671401|nr:3-hydroxyacyl-CoA dehydrogenase/enoyl-CoA hydratase family protein [Novosphingobium sp. KACC 22771]WDF73181.1 3-hydroxyacyl-CoA dehydrogenase NAD-binding domain-containing protein [Novosphingobium sp. KACC 22771]
MAINKVCVIGAGTMGAGIAAQVANAGVPVLLLDIVRDADDRNSVAAGAVERLKKAEPAAFMSKAAAKLVEVGNIDDDLGRVAECDWVIEAIVEKIELKHALYEKLEGVRRTGTAVSSNTSTIPLDRLIEGRSEAFARDFLITHFFNPPRYMRLLEVVSGPKSDPELVASVSDFADRAMGKTVVRAKDTPGFLANRVGTYWLQAAINAAFEQGVSVEDADAIGGKPMGVPKTGIFGLVDLVGIDLMPYLKASLTSTLPANDPYQGIAHDHPLILKMIADGYTGRKGKGGFYRINREAGKVKEAINLSTGEYAKAKKPVSIPSAAQKDLRALISAPGVVGAYAWAVLGPTLAYAAGLIGEASDDILSIDTAMKLGYNWKYGPFELIDRIGGADFVARLQAEGREVPAILTMADGRPFYRVENGQRQYLGADGAYHAIVRPDGVLLLEDIKAASKPILKSGSAALWDIGDGVVALEFTGKMNALDGEVMKLIEKAIPLVTEQYKALVVYNEGSNFSAGANLGLAIFAINIAAWGEVEKLVAGGQKAYKALKYAPFPVVAAPFGMALGGGCEICLNSDAVQAHAETYIGLVECGVGLIPGWGGCGELMVRAAENPKAPKGPMPPVGKAFETISTATVAKSAANAKEIGYLRPGDGITMNRDRLLADAKARALSMVEGYAPPAPPVFRLPGAGGKTALELAVKGFRARGLATPYDEVVADKLATVLTGGDADVVDTVTEEQLLALELREFMTLVRDSRTQARVEHMLTTGKPLRN